MGHHTWLHEVINWVRQALDSDVCIFAFYKRRFLSELNELAPIPLEWNGLKYPLLKKQHRHSRATFLCLSFPFLE